MGTQVKNPEFEAKILRDQGRFAGLIGSDVPIGFNLASGPSPTGVPTTSIPVQMNNLLARREQLREGQFLPATSGPSKTDPSYTDGVKTWWQNAVVRAEHAPEHKAFLQMPDNYTPNKTGGRSLDSTRRTHRMKYEGAGVIIRIPSATSIKRFSNENGHQTFDLPIEVKDADGTTQGFVRVTQSGVGTWSVVPLAMQSKSGLRAAEAVSAVLESRRPSVALREVESLYERRKARVQAERNEMPLEEFTGVTTFLTSSGYDPTTERATVRMGKRLYGYAMSRELYQAFRSTRYPSNFYNKFVKGKARRFPVAKCDNCHSAYNASQPHRCRVSPTAPGSAAVAGNEFLKRADRFARS